MIKKFTQLYNLLEDTEDDLLSKGIDVYNSFISNLQTRIYYIRREGIQPRWMPGETAESWGYKRPHLNMGCTTIKYIMDFSYNYNMVVQDNVFVYTDDGNTIRMNRDEFFNYLAQAIANGQIVHFNSRSDNQIPSKETGTFITKHSKQLLTHVSNLFPTVDLYHIGYLTGSELPPDDAAWHGLILRDGAQVTIKSQTAWDGAVQDDSVFASYDAEDGPVTISFKCETLFKNFVQANHVYKFLTGKQTAYVMDNVVKGHKTVRLDVKNKVTNETIPVIYSPSLR